MPDWNDDSNQKQLFLPRQKLDNLLLLLQGQGYNCLGPVVRDGAIQYLPVTSIGDMPLGVELMQAPGMYQLRVTAGDRLFNWSNGPQALKPLLFAARETLWQVQRAPSGEMEFSQEDVAPVPTAVIGVRACDLAALQLQDQHFLASGMEDPHYKRRRDSLLLIGMDCNQPSDTCFCVSTGDGPELSSGFDLGMSELDDGFVLRAGTQRGQEILDGLGLAKATEAKLQQVATQNEQARTKQKRALPDVNLQQLLFQSLQHSHWQRVAERCTACGSCTAVCPTCFCFREHAEVSLDGGLCQQIREWSSCFAADHSSCHGHPVREDIASRYRQWLTHKLAGWHEQYGRSGCVGCGRCISWCPVGVDITREVADLITNVE